MSSICIWGASSTWGAWDKKLGGWVNRLRLFIDEHENKYGYWETYNLGVSGDTSTDVLKRFESEAQAREPKIIIISIGDNDTVTSAPNMATKTPEAVFLKNLEALIGLSKKFTDKIVIMGLKNVDESRVRPVSWDEKVYYSNDLLLKYNGILEKVCAENKIIFLDTFKLLKPEDLENGLHPNKKGHQKMFKAVRDFLISNKYLSIIK